MTPYHHAVSAANKFGGVPEDYMPISEWFDETKGHFSDVRHRALRHHSEGILLCERIFGATLTLSTGKIIPVRWVAEQHVKEDCDFIPTAADWLRHISLQPWMMKVGQKTVTKTVNLLEGAESG